MNKIVIPILILLWVLFCCWWWNCVQKPTTSCGAAALAGTTTTVANTPILALPDTTQVASPSASDTAIPTANTTLMSPSLAEEEEVLFRPLRVYFGPNQSTFLRDTAVDNFLEVVHKYLAKYPNKRLLITGYSDSDGLDVLNQRLSMKRADDVKRLLQKEGFNASQLIIEGKGEQEPIVPNDSPQNKAQNRRVDVILQP